uniref:Uncharacterized protein n=1 Tax=Micrurus paraensis TaxID=1970185 RepID=A0A2D4K4A5_9SAUR
MPRNFLASGRVLIPPNITYIGSCKNQALTSGSFSPFLQNISQSQEDAIIFLENKNSGCLFPSVFYGNESTYTDKNARRNVEVLRKRQLMTTHIHCGSLIYLSSSLIYLLSIYVYPIYMPLSSQQFRS